MHGNMFQANSHEFITGLIFVQRTFSSTLTPPSAEAKNEWSSTSPTPYASMMCTGIIFFAFTFSFYSENIKLKTKSVSFVTQLRGKTNFIYFMDISYKSAECNKLKSYSMIFRTTDQISARNSQV
jgi:hypothetical protein